MPQPIEVRDFLRQSDSLKQFVSPENIRAFNLPQELIDKTDEVVVLVTEVSNSFTKFASNHSQGRRSIVQIQAWFTNESDIDQFQLVVNQTMENNNWFAYIDMGINVDPDTQQLYWTTEYVKHERMI